ncbi:MAG: PD-(D/E)XK nuclease family protein [Lentisphaeria bacterium]|nr:PD-(D/E)XK nuclease family protein [Lentisphaeria bacterium]
MSRILTNDLTWSVSRSRLFRSCQRAYYYQYYGAWGGWDPKAPERARLLYILKQMTSFPLWGGAIVHDVIKDCLIEFQSRRVLPELSALQEAARAKLNAGWKQSRSKAWQQDPKRNANLFEHYYAQDGEQVPPEEIAALRAKVFDALESFRNCEILTNIEHLDATQWGTIDTLTNFVVGELPAQENAPALPLKIWCALDFSYMDNDGILHIVDWKTGTEHRDELRLQLACYALFAMHTYKLPLEKISLEGVFLNDGGRLSTYEIKNESIVSGKDQILNSALAMRAKLRDPVENLAEEDDFLCTTNPAFCATCPYQQICPRAKGEA